MKKTNFLKVALACIVTFFSLIGCEKLGEETFPSQTFVKGDYLLTPKVEIVVETIKEVVHDTLYYKVVVMDSIFIHDTIPPVYIYDTVKVEVPTPYPVHDTVIVVQRDTVWNTIIEKETDTLYVDNSFSGILHGKAYVAGRKKAAVQRYILDKGEIVNQEVLYGTFHFSLTAGRTEVKNEAVLNSSFPNISGNTFSFDVTDGVGGANVSNVWGYEYNAVAQFDGFTETIDAELSIETADFYQRSLEWRHMVTSSLNGIPQATATWEFWKEEEVVPEPEVVRDTTYSSAVPMSATQAKVIRNITANGQLESSKDIFVPYAVKFECGEKEMISNMSLLDYGKAVAAKRGANTVAMNIHSFNATVDIPSKLNFSDEGKQITVDFAYTNLAIESNGAITRTDNSDDKYERVNNTAYFKLVLNGFSVATDTKEIEQKKEKPEPEVVRDTTYSSAVPMSATQAKVVRTITTNGKQESSKDILVNYSVAFECGNKESISNMATLDYGKAVAAKDGANTVAMNIHSFNATVDVPSKLTFSDEGKQITVDFVYASLAIESNGAITRTDNSNDKFELVNNTAYFKVVLDGFSVATDTKEIEQKKEKPEPEVVRDTTYSSAVPVSATQAKVVRTITANGKQESSKDILVDYSATLECGNKETISNMATLDYGKAVAAKDGANTVAMNIHSFNATVEVPSTLTFSDEGKQITVNFAYTNLAIESNGAITRTDNSNDKFELINNTAYFKLVLNGFTVATDNKEIEQKKEISYRWEWDENVKFSPDMKQVTRRGYLVKNNVRTGFYKDISVNLEYTFTPGAALEFNSNETPSIKDANAVLVGNEAFIPHILGSTEFNANFTYGGTSRVTFSYSDEYVSDESTVDLNIAYSVKATGAIEQNGTSYSTPAALYANGVEVKNEKFVFEVKPIQATYSGYRVYNAGQWAITRIYNQNATTSLVVLVGTLEHIQSGDIYAIHQVLEGSAGNLPENFQKISTPSFGEPYSMYYNVAASAWNYGSIVGAKKGTTNANWMYFNWSRTDNQIVSVNTATDLLDDVVLYQLGSEDNTADAGNISLTYNGQTITVVSDK